MLIGVILIYSREATCLPDLVKFLDRGLLSAISPSLLKPPMYFTVNSNEKKGADKDGDKVKSQDPCKFSFVNHPLIFSCAKGVELSLIKQFLFRLIG